LIGTSILGYADVFVLSNGSQIKTVDKNQFVPTINGGVLNIRFRMETDAPLDPQNNRVQLDTLQRAALAVGRALKVELAKKANAVHVHRTVERAHVRGGSKMAARTRPMVSSRPKAKTRKTIAK
jgi:hypothetical protein